jgi:phosphocarrier protein
MEAQMKSFDYVLKDPVGIHARPAGLLVKEAKKYLSAIEVKSGGKSGDAKKLFSLMKLSAKCGQTVTFEISGEDEEKAFEELKVFIEGNL